MTPRSCRVCLEPTTSEGQLCSECVAKGNRIENNTLYVSIDIPGP